MYIAWALEGVSKGLDVLEEYLNHRRLSSTNSVNISRQSHSKAVITTYIAPMLIMVFVNRQPYAKIFPPYTFSRSLYTTLAEPVFSPSSVFAVSVSVGFPSSFSTNTHSSSSPFSIASA